MKPIGHKVWAIPGGRIPVQSTGTEPEFTSYEKLCFLNAGNEEAQVEITLFYAEREPVGPYKVTVAARRIRHFRINDLIDPEAVPLGTDYACLIEATVPIVVQFIRQDTRQSENSTWGAIAFPLM